MRMRLISMAVVFALVSVVPVAFATTAANKSTVCLSGTCGMPGSVSIGSLTLNDISSGLSLIFTSTSEDLKLEGFIGDKSDFVFRVTRNQDRFASGEMAIWGGTATDIDLTKFSSNNKMAPYLNGLVNTGNPLSRIDALAEAPEIGFGTYTMFLAGLGVIGAMVRRRRMALF